MGHLFATILNRSNIVWTGEGAWERIRFYFYPYRGKVYSEYLNDKRHLVKNLTDRFAKDYEDTIGGFIQLFRFICASTQKERDELFDRKRGAFMDEAFVLEVMLKSDFAFKEVEPDWSAKDWAAYIKEHFVEELKA